MQHAPVAPLERAPLEATPGTAEALLRFIRPQAAKPAFESSAMTGGAPRYFFETEERRVRLHDLRALPAPSLDREGFRLLHAPSAVPDLTDDAEIERLYLPETKGQIATALGASEVYAFDVTRRSDATGGAANKDGRRGPAGTIHVDYTAKSGPQRFRDAVGAETAERILAEGRRVVQVNLWRPIRGPVRRSPLALAVADSVRAEHLVATDQIFPDRVGEIYHLAYDAEQRWVYAPLMTPDEALLIKGWDSLDDGRARFTPHSAAKLLPTPDDAAPRESIEVRTFAVV
jgi:hypothetical protein